MRRLLAAIFLIEVVFLLGCKGDGGDRPIPTPSRVGETPPPAPPPPPPPQPVPGTQFSTAATVTVRVTETGAVDYVTQIELAETAGVRSTVTGVVLEFASWYGNRSYPFGPEIWIGGATVLPNGTLRSQPIVVREDFPSFHYEQLYARLTFTDAASASARLLNISALVPPPPAPPPGAKLAMIGTVTNESRELVSGATVSILAGPNAGRSATTNDVGEYRLDALKPGSVSLEVSRPGYTTTGFSDSLPSSMTWNLLILD